MSITSNVGALPSSVSAAERLADFAVSLRFEDIPPLARQRARDCLIDAVGCAIFGRTFPWSEMVMDFARSTGAGGPCQLPGVTGEGLHPPQAALAMGTFAHAFELDSLRKPGVGVHPGGTVAVPAFLMAQAVGASGPELLRAIVAGCEVMFRIGSATLHSPEERGFHSPGLTGPFGSAIACATLMRLSADQTANALGIAASLAGGLLAFANSGSGGMVKRLHMGRAAEAGVVAASLAARGYEGPHLAIEGGFGFLAAFCNGKAPELLLQDLGSVYETERICLKSYACHVMAHAPVRLMRQWVERGELTAPAIRTIAIYSSPKAVSHHGRTDPSDVMDAQYSIPFCVALAAYRDPSDPTNFSREALADERIRELARRIELRADPARPKGWGTRLRIELDDGRVLEEVLDVFPGSPEVPLSESELEAKFMGLARGLGVAAARDLFAALASVESATDMRSLCAGGKAVSAA